MRRLMSATILTGSILLATGAQAEIKVGFITSLSGGAAALGIPYGKGMKAAQIYKRQIGTETIKVIELDDASDPSAATRNARKLIEEENVDILIGTSTVPSSIAMTAVAKELKVPMIALSPISSADADQWSVTVPQSPVLMGKVIAQRMKRDGKTKIGYIGFSDSWGDLVYDGAKQAEAEGLIKVLTNERYARTDTSVTGQILKILATQPDGVLIGGSSTQAALPLIELAKRSYKGGLYGLAPLVNADFVRVGGKSVEGVKVTIGPVVVAEQLPDTHFAKALSLAFRDAYQKANGEATTDGFSAYSFDAWLVFTNAAERALRNAKPGTAEFRSQLRDEILKTKELAGVHGVYNFSKGSSYGVDERSLVIVQLVNGVWKYEP
ncbi:MULTISPECIES: ABC transporter substrate-binding protein [unclassified Beijerinckia]|uniref:ABC transporter substrate-binding protein n=1 Tax=unclassified Beijerinckia TaxID=2638183 RepID=UPI00089A403A|nr:MULTISPECIES: ABC transporter substrate-binding protein [unclassified Beijerinckia]MDH7798482.1 branched-chain amino acid transport system substrate-binding protein [Beijerinckia sp. GAS462]SED22371.1 branched-chain amino acid transport system substrate-binding protein [Beijerinckia sp. 28-YEA-48]